MHQEIERKFLVTGDAWRDAPGVEYRQGYLSTDPGRSVRVRLAGGRGTLTIKGATTGAATRAEFEYEIPAADAAALLDTLCERPLIEKRRHQLDHAGHRWVVDDFFGDNAGLVVAEIELESETEAFERPAWLGREVTADPRYFNAALVRAPFSTWGAVPDR